MSEYIHLIGAEDVKRAGHEMSSAADSIRQSVTWLCEELQRTREMLAEHAARLEAIEMTQAERDA